MVGVAARVASVQVPWPTVEEWPGLNFTNHITALEALLTEMQLRVRGPEHHLCVITGVYSLPSVCLQVPVPFWSVQATQPAWAEAGSEHQDPDDTLEGLIEVIPNKTPPCFQPPCCGLLCVG